MEYNQFLISPLMLFVYFIYLWLDGRTDGLMDKQMDGQTDERMDGRMDKWTDGQMDRQTQADGQMDGQTCEISNNK